jgi:hypothetical protein
MKKTMTLSFFLFLLARCFSQQMVDLEENQPYEYNGLEYGYYISNERSKDVKGDDYERYEVNLYVTNKSGCIKIIPLRTTQSGNNEDVVIAEFNCKNANGKRLTAKSGKVNAKPWYMQVRVPDEANASKYKLINAQAGYAIKNGQTFSSKIIVIVPKGERPKISCRTVYFADL